MTRTRLLLRSAALLFVGSPLMGQRAAGASTQRVSPAAAEPTPALTLVKASRLLDPRTGSVLSPAAVLIQDGKITDVGPPSRVQANAPAGVRTIDLGGATLLPGLIDSHTHLLLDVVVPPEAEMARRPNGIFVPGLLLAMAESPGKRVLLGARMAREVLESGFTTVRNLGHSGVDGDVALRDAIEAGHVPGPRILASGRKLIALGSYIQGLDLAVADAIMQREFLPVDGPDRARQAVRQNVFYNVDVIKVTLGNDLSTAEVRAIVDAAHQQGLRVAAHAIDSASIRTAIDAGVNSIEHGNDATDEQLRQMRERGIALDLTPTFYGDFRIRISEPSIVMSATSRSSLEGSMGRRKKQYDSLVERVLKSGVKFAAGSDMCWYYPGKTRGQATASTIVHLHDAGMPSLDILRAVTVNAAEMLGWRDRVGAVEPGKFADLVAVTGDPVADIGELERIRFVMKGGQVIRNDLAGAARPRE